MKWLSQPTTNASVLSHQASLAWNGPSTIKQIANFGPFESATTAFETCLLDWVPRMSRPSEDDAERLSRSVAAGDCQSLDLLLSLYRERLKKMVVLRLSPELSRRLDGSDIIQEAFLQAAMNIDGYVHDPERPFYLWIRKITENKLLEAHRRHIVASKRGVYRELNPRDSRAMVSSASFASFFIDNGSGPADRAMSAELQEIVQAELEAMDEIDREVLVMRHFEQLSLPQIATVLGLSKSGAAKRYRRAVESLREVFATVPGVLD
ncbi:MAG: sigma-70 family RNA polymerase sigma factor [Pirellulaceae bacterium]